MVRKQRWIPRTAAFGILAAAVLNLAGCGDGGKGVVSGKVTVGGKPVTHASITFLSEVGNKDAFTSGIVNGEYITEPIPVGATKIFIIDREVEPGGPGANTNDLQKTRPVSSKTVKVHGKYSALDTSGLTYDVVRGEQKKDFELEGP